MSAAGAAPGAAPGAAAGAAPGAAAGGASASGLPDSPPNISWLNGRKVVVFKKSDIKDLKPGEEWVEKAAAIFNRIVAKPEYNDVQFAFELNEDELQNEPTKLHEYVALTQEFLASRGQEKAFVVIKAHKVAMDALKPKIANAGSGVKEVTKEWAAVRAMKDSPIKDYEKSEYEAYVATLSAGAAVGGSPGSPASAGVAAPPASVDAVPAFLAAAKSPPASLASSAAVAADGVARSAPPPDAAPVARQLCRCVKESEQGLGRAPVLESGVSPEMVLAGHPLSSDPLGQPPEVPDEAVPAASMEAAVIGAPPAADRVAPTVDRPPVASSEERGISACGAIGALEPNPAAAVPALAVAAAAAAAPAAEAAAGVTQPPAPGSSVAGLMDQYTKAWKDDKKSFDFPEGSFNLESFKKHLVAHTERFKKANVDSNQHFGYIEKFDLDPAVNPQIYVRADLHGDLKSLIENIRTLQQQGLMDENFKCKPGVHLVFLGDYCDRGVYGTQILEMLMVLREENPDQVHLIRGNHESTRINGQYGRIDGNLLQILSDEDAANALDSFYETMSLSTYLSVNQGARREYVQFSHGLFELTMDPAPLLDLGASGACLPVPKERKLSDRIVRKISDCKDGLQKSAQRINELVLQLSLVESDMTAYNWADVSEEETNIGSLARRRYYLSPGDIRHYLDLSSDNHDVMMIFRGHQHKFQHYPAGGKVVVTTLPVGMDSCVSYQNLFPGQPDLAYIITPQAKVEGWTKRAITRERGHGATDAITVLPVSLTSSDV